MRLWSLSPQYLDAAGLVALWRESLLARQALRGEIHGYTNHPQLYRFKRSIDPLLSIEYYLNIIFLESQRRNYNFNESKIQYVDAPHKIEVTTGQLKYEFCHLRKKLKLRAPSKYEEISKVALICPHPLFNVINGGIETWEKVKKQ